MQLFHPQQLGDSVFGQFGIHRDPLDRLYSEKQFMTPLE
jgi:hypothetical protein